MARTGIENPWRDDNEPEPLDTWLSEGFERSEAESWRGWRFTLSSARAWRAAGVGDGLRAAQWATARATPETVGGWQAVGIDATEAVQWHEFGFDLAAASSAKARGLGPADAFQSRSGTPPGLRGAMAGLAPGPRSRPLGPTAGPMRAFMAAGVSGDIIHGYMARQWFDDESLAWAKQHIDAAEIALWRELGLRPLEAGRLVRRGLTLMSVVREWWAAGIPIDEVADWIGAGLSADEAAAQRAKGITAEQAAALRALRDQADE